MLAVLHILEREDGRLAGLDPLDLRLAVADLHLDLERVLGAVGDHDVVHVALVGDHAALVVDLRPLDAARLVVALVAALGQDDGGVVGELAGVRVRAPPVAPVVPLALVARALVVATLVLVRERTEVGGHGRGAGVDATGVAVGRVRRAGQKAEPHGDDCGDGSEATDPTSGTPDGSSRFGCTHAQFSLACSNVPNRKRVP